MISKLGLGIFAAAAMALFVAPSTSFAASADKTKTQIKKFSKALNKLPNGAAPANVVGKYVAKLTKLDPKKAKKWYSTGLKKLAIDPGSRDNAKTILESINKIIAKADLSDSQKKKLIKQTTKENLKYNPLPYQAYMSFDRNAVLA